MRKPTFWFSTRSDTNQAVQSQEMARGLKFRFKKVEGLYYLCSENKGADQLRGYHEADLRLCFRICKMLVFSQRGSYIEYGIHTSKSTTDMIASKPIFQAHVACYWYRRCLRIFLCN